MTVEWALIGLLTATYFGLFTAMRHDRRDLMTTLVGLRGDIVTLRTELHNLGVVLARLDERVRHLEERP